MSKSYSKNIEFYWMLIMTVIALIISATFLEGWFSIYVLLIAGITYSLSSILVGKMEASESLSSWFLSIKLRITCKLYL